MTTFMTYKEECEALRQRVQELETQLAKNNPLLDEAADAIDKLTAERNELLLYKNLANEYGLSGFKDISELKKQRDELLAALEYAAACHVTEGNDSIEMAIASVKGQT